MHVRLLTAVLIATPALAQDTIAIGGLPARTDMSKGVLNQPIANRVGVRLKTERKAMVDWPDRDLTLATPPLWSNPLRSIALNHPASALAVERVRGGAPGACESFFCWSGYRLTVTLEGPVGARPFGFTRPDRPRRR